MRERVAPEPARGGRSAPATRTHSSSVRVAARRRGCHRAATTALQMTAARGYSIRSTPLHAGRKVWI
eukprot:5293227-Pleurochrysis_carterae.AAC.1